MPTPAQRTFPAAALAGLLLVLTVAGAGAQSPPRLEWPLTDLVAAVEDPAAVERAAQELRDRADVQLFTLYTDTTGGVPATEYAEQVASANGLGVGDALYVVTTGDRSYALWLGDGLAGKVSVERQDEIMLDAEARLADGDLAGAAVMVARELQDSLTGGGLPVLPILLVLGLVAAIAGGWYLLTQRRKAAAGEARREQLSSEANTLLLETDEQVRNAGGELGFVEAMYGAAEVEPYARAVEEARAELNAAFAIRQKLDDAEPEDAATAESMLGELTEHARKAGALLAAQQERIRKLRDVERDAPRLVEVLSGQLPALEARLPQADQVRASLEQRYAPSDWEAVRGNRTEAAKRIESARAAIADATAALAATDSSKAAVEVLEATQAMAEATALLDALDGAASQLAAAQAQLDGELREAATDIAAAQDVVARGAAPDAAARLGQAVATLEEARRAAAMAPPSVLGALQKANTAEAIADELVAGARAAEEERARQSAMLQGTISSARAKVEMASGYVGTRRHGVGSTPRVRVSEAQRHLDAAIALMGPDPAQAMAEARRAEQLADEAYQLASSDFDAWDQRAPTTIGSGGSGGGGSLDLGGILLGTLIGGMMSGGGGSGPGWGGTSWGGRGGGGRSRPPTPRLPSGGGGGGGRSRGGGGGRARGGRW
jgi:hypothetical protein